MDRGTAVIASETFRSRGRPMLMRRTLVLSLLILTAPLHGQRSPYAPGTGNPAERLVPWRFLEKDAPIEKTPVVLYWLPASLEETKRSPLLTSRVLIDDSLRCVSMLVVLPEDSATIEKLGATGKLPMAVVSDAQGRVIRSVPNVRGVLRPADIEHALNDELHVRDESMYREMTEARKLAASDKNASIALYKKIWEDRCLFPVAGRDAQRALKSLGVVVVDVPAPPPPDPGAKVTNPTTKTHS